MSNVIVDKLSVAVVLSLVALAAGHPSHVVEVSEIFADDGSFAHRILGDNDLQVSHCPGKEVQEQSFQRASFGTSFIEAADLELGTEEVTGSFNKKSAKKAAKKAAKIAAKAVKKAAKASKKAEKKAAKASKKARNGGETSKANMSINRKLVKLGVLTKGCVATQKTLDAVNAMVPYTGTGKHPRWDFRTACRDTKGNFWYRRKAGPIVKCKRTLATISCPCDGSNGPLSATQAMSKILGQLGAMPTKLNLVATARKINTMRTGLASIRMLRCRQNVCKQKEKSEKKKTADQSLDELLVDVGRPDGDLDAGWDCG